MPDNQLRVVKISIPKDVKNNKTTKQRGSNIAVMPTRAKTQENTSPLVNFIELGKSVTSDSRSINYLISTLSHTSSDNLILRRIWLTYKDMLKLNKIDLSTAILLVQASGKSVAEQGKPSRIYFIKAAHEYTLKARNGSQRFYINLVHSLHSCDCNDLKDVYTQIKNPALSITPSTRDNLVNMLDAAVQEYQTFGLRNDVVYADDQPLPQTQSTAEKHPNTNHADPAEQSLQAMAVQVDKQIKDHCSKFADPQQKVEKINTQTLIVAEEMESPNQEAVLLAIKEKDYVTAIQRAAEEQNWISATEIFDQAIAEIPNSALVYNVMLLAADKCSCFTYAKILYVKAITDNFADKNTHINALLIFAKTYEELDWVWYAYCEIKRLYGINSDIFTLMIAIALLSNAPDYAIAIYNDVVENGFEPDSETDHLVKWAMEHINCATQVLKDRSAIHEASADDNSGISQINLIVSAKRFSPLSSSLVKNEYSLFGVRSFVPVTNQVPENSFSLYTL